MSEKTVSAIKKSGNKGKDIVSKKPKADLSHPEPTASPMEKILYLQRTIGNRAVTRLIQSGALQAKLKPVKENLHTWRTNSSIQKKEMGENEQQMNRNLKWWLIFNDYALLGYSDGVFDAVKDWIMTIPDIIKLIWSLITDFNSVIDGFSWQAWQALAKSLKGLVTELKSPDPKVAGSRFGWIVGYAAVEITIAFLTGGTATGAKLGSKGTQVIDKLRNLLKIEKWVSKSKSATALRKRLKRAGRRMYGKVGWKRFENTVGETVEKLLKSKGNKVGKQIYLAVTFPDGSVRKVVIDVVVKLRSKENVFKLIDAKFSEKFNRVIKQSNLKRKLTENQSVVFHWILEGKGHELSIIPVGKKARKMGLDVGRVKKGKVVGGKAIEVVDSISIYMNRGKTLKKMNLPKMKK